MNRLLIFCYLTLISMNIAWAEKTPQERFARASSNYDRVVRECLLPDFSKKQCYFLKHYSPLKVGTVTDSVIKVFYNALLPIGHGLSEGMNFAYLSLVDPGDENYWSRDLLMQDFENIKGMIWRKQEQEGLSRCQSVCLATCVSSRLINYVDSFPQSYQETVQNSSGVCREFASVAQELLNLLGVRNTLAAGTAYKINLRSMEKNESQGHVMNYVWVDNQKYVVEPQLGPEGGNCNFFDPDFEQEQVKVEKIKIN